MRTDYKVGLTVGIGFAVLLVVILATRPRKAPAPAPAQQPQQIAPVQERPVNLAPVPAPEPNLQQSQVQPVAPPVPPPRPPRVHTVREGETLSDISERYYGTPNRWERIYRANQSIIRDPDRIHPGMRLIIPD